ncbi:pumilio homology domain family member 6 [[Candida] jaroonii]|uniref:Pumilio homology domain family member 6 n=1 Tax=[Candida] jaroonii TaxID=467808 RepID=A0ACA9Y681_9ASCO|nr:pumilio homology domain family member 6 [[Candida] jaroonii]
MGSKVRSKRSLETVSDGKKKARIAQVDSESEGSENEFNESEVSEESQDELDQSEDELDQSEDELDQSEDELDQSDNEDNEEDKENSTDPNKKSSKEQHAEQRKLLAERKLKRKSGVQVQEIKSLWERLRVNKPPPPKQVREKLTNEIWELSNGVILDLVMKHDASRVVQTLVKYASKERREIIVKSLKGNFYQLATSSYGKYLLIKLLHYGSKESRALIVDELHGKLRKLMRHREGAYVVEDLFVLYSTGEQRQQMIREFWGAEYAVFKESGKDKTVLDIIGESAEKKQLILANLNGTITASVEKGSTGFQILHAAMKEYITILSSDIEEFDKQIREFEELLGEQFAELVHTSEGSEVACCLIAMANAKERKTIMKTLKQHNKDLIKNEHGNLVLITLFMTVDDTVSLHKNFDNDLFTPELLPELIQGKFSRRPLLYLLKGLDGKYFNPLVKKELNRYETLAYQKTSKKPQDQRREELLTKSLPKIYKNMLESFKNDDTSIDKILSSNLATQSLTELILTPTDLESVNDDLRPKLIDEIFNAVIKGDVLEDFHLLNKVPFISRSIKSLIHGNEFQFNQEKKKLIKVEGSEIPGIGKEFALRVMDEILSNDKLQDWCSGQGSFIIVAIYEVLDASNDKKLKELTGAIKKIKKQLSEDGDNKGAKILLNIIN